MNEDHTNQSELDEIFDLADPTTPTLYWRKERAKDRVRNLANQAVLDELAFVRDHSSGGGDWRRVIEQRIGYYQAKLKGDQSK